MKNIYLIGAFLLLFSCQSNNSPSNTQAETAEAPEWAEFEYLRTASPEGTIPNVKSRMIRYFENYYGGKSGSEIARTVFPNTWRPVNDFFATLAVTRIVYDPQDTEHFFFCTGEGWFNADAARGAGLWHSRDAGQSWDQMASTDNDTFTYCQDMVVHPVSGDIYVCTRGYGVVRSKDGGDSWEVVLDAAGDASGNNAADIELTADNEIVVAMGIFNEDGVYFSTTGDAGSWEKRMNGMPQNDYYRIEIATAPSDASRLYAIPTGTTDRRIKGIWRSDDKGLNWVAVSNPGGDRQLARRQGWYDLIVQVDPNDADKVVVGGLNNFVSEDAGDTWYQLAEGSSRGRKDLQYMHVDQHEVLFKTSDTVLFGNDGGIYKSDNFTSDSPLVYDINKNYNVTQYYSGAIYPQKGDHRVFGGTQDNGTYISSSDGISDFSKLSWADGSFCEVSSDGEVMFTTTQYRRIYRFRGDRIDTITNTELINDNTLFINPIAMDPNNSKIIYQASNVGLWRLKNAYSADSTRWEKACASFGPISAIGISKTVPNMIVFGRTNGGQVFRIENADQTDENYFPKSLDRFQQIPTGYHSCVAINPTDANHIIVTLSNYGVESIWETRNGLDDDPAWTLVEGDLPDMPVRWALFHPKNPDGLYIATEFGVWYTTKLDGDQTEWKPTIASLANLRVDMLRLRESDGTVLAATHGRGIYTGQVNDEMEIDWVERGPRNVGGRTRTMMFDPNDPAGKRLWAGSVSGGLWVVDNYDSVAVSIEVEDPVSVRGVYPNPIVQGQLLKIELGVDELPEEVDFFNLSGQLISRQEDLLVIDNALRVSTRGLQQGMYIVRLKTNLQEEIIKILVQGRN
jgi:photosystem II stability/assembly factor-like uncharacterized protein